MALNPQYVGTPRTAAAVISTANANRDGTGTIATVFTAGASGSRIDTIVLEARATTTAGMIRLFVHDGTTAWLYDEIPVVAVTPSGTVPAWNATVGANAQLSALKYPLILASGWSLRAATQNAETFNVMVTNGGDF